MVGHKRLLWQVLLPFLTLILIAVTVITLFVLGTLKRFYLEQNQNTLEAVARLVQSMVADRYTTEQIDVVNTLCRVGGEDAHERLTVILPDGTVIGDSRQDPRKMENHGDRPEVRGALAGRTSISIRYSPTIGEEMMYVAVPAMRNGRVVGVVRAATPIPAITAALQVRYERILLVVLLVAALAAGASFLVAQRINQPLRNIKSGAARLARGELNYRLPLPDSEELATLAQTINDMAAELEQRIRTITAQRNELEAILSNMAEAVLVLDEERRIVRCNRAALSVLELDRDKVQDHPLNEVIRNADLRGFLERLYANQSETEAEIALQGERGRFLHAHGSFIRNDHDTNRLALVVFNDITRIQRLETIRRDFVANVSHELKTPITSIKGFVETLLDGAIQDEENAREFLAIVKRHADRLDAIIEDLLSLSRLDQDADKRQIRLDRERLKPVLKSALLICRAKAAEKQIAMELNCDENISAQINAPLLEQAIVNLVDNAIKYSEPGHNVVVSVTGGTDEVRIDVTDQGSGIPPEHLSRIFERFYRVDKARSRKLGGTGLGLAIVKHIVQVHTGRIEVQSMLDQGSTFSIFLRV